MFHLNKLLNNQKGLTLIELLASIVIMAIISIFTFSLIAKAIENNRVIQQEATLRDEADIIVSKFIKTLYSTKQGYIVRNTSDEKGSYIEVTDSLEKCQKDEDGNFIINPACFDTLKPIGFITDGKETKIRILGEGYSVSQKNIQILPNSKVNGDPTKTSIYEIELHLKITHKRGTKETTKEMTFKNQIQPVLTSK